MPIHGGHLRDWEEWIRPKPLQQRLVDKTIPGPLPPTRPELGHCLLWAGYIAQSGYGVISIFGHGIKRKVLAHRLAYELAKGEIPDGLDIDHLCSVKRCVNPAHMEPVTRRENFLRANNNEGKTHCPQGHPYSPENTTLKKSRYGFRRECHACTITAQRRARAADRPAYNTRKRAEAQRRRAQTK